ncbi:myotubularin-related protein 11 isoform X2 [Pogona vitticeps]
MPNQAQESEVPRHERQEEQKARCSPVHPRGIRPRRGGACQEERAFSRRRRLPSGDPLLHQPPSGLPPRSAPQRRGRLLPPLHPHRPRRGPPWHREAGGCPQLCQSQGADELLPAEVHPGGAAGLLPGLPPAALPLPRERPGAPGFPGGAERPGALICPPSGILAFQVTMAIAQAQESSSWDGSYESVAWKNLENGQPSQEEEDPPTLLFESLCDWEKELKRLGAEGWRVSPANERFDMSTSLPKYLLVPSRSLDNELKRAFVHFNERRIPRLSWHHPGGSDLLRAASFHPDSDPEKEDMRSVETLMLAGHSQCVIVETAADLPTPAEVQQAYAKLWSLSLCLADSVAAPSDEKWLSSLEGTRWLEHVRACLKKASEVAVLLAERKRSVVLQESDDRDLNCLLASLVQVLSDPHTRTISGFQSLIQKEWVAAGHPFQQRLNLLQKNDREESPVFLLFLDCVWQLLQQFPCAFEFTDAYLVALHDSSYLPFASTFLFNCQWERGRKNQNRFLNQLYTPINGWREDLCLEILQKESKEAEAAHLPTLWDWAVSYSPRQRAQFRNPFYLRSSPAGGGRALNGNFLPPKGDQMQNTPPGKGTLYVFSKGSLALQTHFFPWKNGSLVKKGTRRAPLAEGTGEQERPPWGKASPWLLYQDGPLLLPSLVGPRIRLWRRCYLRGNPDFPLGLFAPSLSGLAEELERLQDQLQAAKKKLPSCS